MPQEVFTGRGLSNHRGNVCAWMFGLNDYIKAIEQGWHQGVGPLILVIRRGKQTKLVVNQALTEILPLAPFQAIENETLFCLWEAVDLIDNFHGQACEGAPDHNLFSLVEFPQVRPPDDFFLCLLGMPTHLTAPDNSQGQAVQ